MKLGKEDMAVVIVQLDDVNSIPKTYKNVFYGPKMGNTIPRGFVLDMAGDKVLNTFSYAALKKETKDTYKVFSELTKLEKKKPVVGSFGHIINKEVDAKYFLRDVSLLSFERQVKYVLISLAHKAVKKDDMGKEAQTIIDAINDWGAKELSATMKLKDSQPTLAYQKMWQLYKIFKGLPISQKVVPDLKIMKKDKYLRNLFTLRKQHDFLMSNKRSSVSSKKKLAKVIQKFIDKYSLSDALKNDANLLISSLK